jgi:HPt (histidine-containing phosphotransfer) domain-containing protein
MNETTKPSTFAILANAGVRTVEALARFGGDEQRYRHWLIDFISYGPTAAREIRSAISPDSSAQAASLTHAFKGRSGMLGMIELHSIAVSLEMALKNGEPADLWIDELENTVNEMVSAISSMLGETGG